MPARAVAAPTPPGSSPGCTPGRTVAADPDCPTSAARHPGPPHCILPFLDPLLGRAATVGGHHRPPRAPPQDSADRDRRLALHGGHRPSVDNIFRAGDGG